MLTRDSIKEKIRRTYMLAACAITLLMTGSYLDATQIQPKIINIAGYQRMLSQRIAFLQTLLTDESKEVEQKRLRNELIASTSEFLRNHEILVGRQPLEGVFTPLSEELEQLYFSDEGALDKKALQYGENALYLASASAARGSNLKPVTLAAATAMLRNLDRAVQLFETQLSRDIKFNQMMLLAVWFITTCLALLIILLLFRPLKNLVLDQFAMVQETRNDILNEREQTNRMMSSTEEFIKAMSREFRSPIAVIIGALELLPNAKNRQAALLQKAENACYTLLSLSSNLMESLSGDTSVTAKAEDFILVRALDDAYSEFLYNCQKKNLNHQIVNDSSLPYLVHGYPELFVKALKSVLDNAVKFTPHGMVSVYNRVAIVDGARVIIIRVVDTGIGIHEDELERIFERFTTCYDPAYSFSGAGTGLHTARKLLAKAGGTIAVSSALQSGSEFTLTVPLESAKHQPEALTNDQFSNRFAVVDDQEITRIYIQSMIEAEGFAVDTYKSGADLLANQEKVKSYSGIITDYYMPGINGVELITYLQAIMGKNMPPVMMVSASPHIANVIANSDATAWQVFVKPIDKNRFTDAIKALASNKSLHAPPSGDFSVLVVEDESINAEILCDMLENMGYDVSIAADGETALHKAIEKNYDAILLDLHLPDISGFEVATLLKERGCQSKLVSVTASAYPADAERAFAAGIRYHLVKPVAYQELKSMLRLLLVQD